MASLGELFIELGVIGDTEKLKEFDKKIKETAKDLDLTVKTSAKASNSIGDFVKRVRGIAIAVTGAIYALSKLTNDLAQNNQAFLDLTRTSDIALNTFQKWDNVGRMFGVRNAAQQIENLNQRLFELRLTGEGARGFQLAGVNPMGQDAEGVLEQIRDRIQGLDDTSASYLLRQMGLDPQMLHLLRMTREEFESFQQTTARYRLTEEQSKQIQQMNTQLEIARIKLQYLKDRAILAIMPLWVKLNQMVANLADGFGRIANSINSFISKSPQIEGAFRAIAAGLTVVLAALKPVYAAFTALFLILEDLAVYSQGGDSLFGHLLNVGDNFKEDLKNIFAGFADGNPMAPILKGFEDLKNIKIPIPPIITSIIAAGAAMGSIVQAFSGFANNVNSTPPIQRTVADNRISNVYDQRQINMTNSIQTSQPVQNIQDQLAFANNAIAAGWA